MRLLRSTDELDELFRREPVLRERLLEELLELRDLLELDEPDLRRADPDEPPERLFDPEALLRLEPLDPLDPLLELVLREPVLREPELREPELREPELPCDRWPPPLCCSSPASSSESSFLATVTAAGTAIPTAAPASAFLPVDMP